MNRIVDTHLATRKPAAEDRKQGCGMTPATPGRGYAIGYLENVAVGPEILDYMARIETTFEPYGGEWVVHGTTPEVLEGELHGDIVIIGFPSVAAARAWYDSVEYREILRLRSTNSRSVVALLTGVPPGYRAADTIAKLTT